MASSAALTLPLSALRERLDAPDARWLADPDGLCGRGLSQPAGSRVNFAIRLETDTELRGHARLTPREWRDGTGSVRAWVSAVMADGTARELWDSLLATAAQAGPLEGRALACRLPADIRLLTLGVDQHGQVEGRSAAGALWLDLSLEDQPGTPHEADRRRAPPAGTRGPWIPGESPQRSNDASRPLISVLTPVHDPPLEMLHEAVRSVIGQSFPNWELQLIDDGSKDPGVVAALRTYADGDARIHLHRRQRAQGIAGATNLGLTHARGDYIALLDHDDSLAPSALQRVADTIAAEPQIDMIYTDEDIVMDGRQIWVHHKQAWSPDVLRTNGYTCHLGVYRREMVEEIGAFRSEFNGSQDVDMILRLVERTDRIAHIPEILYHWRAHAASTAGGDAKPYAYVAARNAIAEHLVRTRIGGTVDFGPPGLYRVVHPSAPATRVTIAAAAGEPTDLTTAARSWLAQPHREWRVVIGAPPERLESCEEALSAAGVGGDRVALVPAGDGPPAAALSVAAERAAEDSDQLLLMQSPAVGLTHDWLTRLIGYASQAGVAAAGPLVLGPDGRVRDAGVAIVNGIPLYLLYGQTTSMDDHFGFGTSVHDVSAVSDVLMTSAALFAQAGGLDAAFGSLSLVDFCLRAADGGMRTVTVPDARVQCRVEPVNDVTAMRRLALTHGDDRPDPYYNRNYRNDRGDFLVAR